MRSPRGGNERAGGTRLLEAAGRSEARGDRTGGATRPVCTAPLPHSLMQKRVQTSGVPTFSALVCFILDVEACVFVQFCALIIITFYLV